MTIKIKHKETEIEIQSPKDDVNIKYNVDIIIKLLMLLCLK
jgi:hypothetical protein